MDEKQLQALANELAKNLKTPEDLSQFDRLLKKLCVEAALNAEMTHHLGYEKNQSRSLFKILCKCLVSEVTVQAVTELDNKAAHCHSPVLQRHRPFLGRRLDCQPHHFFHRVVCREHFTLFDRMADHA